MGKFYFLILWACALLFFTKTGYAQVGTSNKGTEFWTAYMDHVGGAGTNGSQMSLYITASVNTSGVVALADGSFSQAYNVAANDVTIVNIPASAFLDESNQDVVLNKGIHITSVQPVAVYAHIYQNSVSGATLLFPVNSMGKDYYSINYTQVSNSLVGERNRKTSYSTFCVIGTEDNTEVQITPSADLISNHTAGSTFSITLNKGQVYQGLSLLDLTGTRVRSVGSGTQSCKRIAVFSGSSKLGIGCGGNISTGTINATSDNLFQQVYPTSAWGKNYYAVPLSDRKYDIFRVVYSDLTAQVKVDGALVSPTNGYYEFTSTTPTIVTSDKPVQMVQYTVSQGEGLNCTRVSNDLGDPEMIFLSPIEQGLDQVTLYSAGSFAIQKSFINIVIPADAVESFRLDNTAYANFKLMPGDNNYAYAQIPVSVGAHNIRADKPFNAIAYGFGNAESYGYAAGTNLRNLNEYVTLADKATNTTYSGGCAGNEYNVQLALPYDNVGTIQWRFSNGALAYTDLNPQYVATKLSADGQTTLYIYEYKNKVSYVSGYFSIIAAIPNPNLSDCGSLREIEFNFGISDYPVADFSTNAKCLGTGTEFKDVSDTKGSTLSKWLWDFGDAKSTTTNPNISTDPNPTHLYSEPGNYLVSLTIINENGCSSTVQKKVYISKLPVAKFKNSIACTNVPTMFTDLSTSADGHIGKWLWDFGDAAATVTDNVSTQQNPVHVYTKPGTYQVVLQVITDSGCISKPVTLDITVHPTPQVSFVMPEVCLNNAAAQFKSTSTIADDTQSEFSYLWYFDDPHATAANPNTSTLANPVHVYSEQRDLSNPYKVKLIVTSKYGCSEELVQNFVVNGANPVAKFKLAETNTFCSAEDVVFVDQSTVDFGVITKIRWYYDVVNKPNEYEEFYRSKGQMHADMRYAHNYGLSNAFQTRQFRVRMVAYSGETSCSNQAPDEVVTVYPNPLITLRNKPVAMCQADGAVTIEQYNPGYAGAGKFTGRGITANGVFNPRLAGPGKHKIYYIFSAESSGCPYKDSLEIIVYPKPVVTAPAEVTVLAGNTIKLNAVADAVDGSKLTYNWTLADGSQAVGLNDAAALNPIAQPAQDTRYLLTVTSEFQCSSLVYVNVKVLQPLVIANTFTPNNDGVNDTWQIKYLETYPNCTVEIFNRNGEKVYSARNYTSPWDGRVSGKDLPAGTYYYIVNPKNGRSVVSGAVTIIR